MAKATVTNQIGRADNSVVSYTWLLTTGDPTGDPAQIPEWADQTWQFGKTGDVLGGATGAVQGSNTDADADYQTLSNAAGATPATFTAFGLKTTIENPLFVRPKLTAVGGGTSITVTLIARRANPMRT
jgi:hypothetical protein